MKGFRIQHQNSNLITFDPIFAQKTVKNWLNRVFCQFSTLIWPKQGSDVIRFEFGDKIWNPPITYHVLGPHMLLFSHFECLTSHVIFFTTKAGGGIIFFENL